MIKFITCLFLVCGLTARAAVYSNEFTAFPNPTARGTVSNIVTAMGGNFGIPTLNGTGTNLNATYSTGSTNSPFVIRDTNGVPLGWFDTNASTGIYSLYLGKSTANQGRIAYNTSNGWFYLYSTNGRLGLIVDAGGSVGIGTRADSTSLFDVPGSVIAASLRVTNPITMGLQASGGVMFSNTATGTHIKGLAFSGTSLFPHTNGNVGIGTATPTAALDVNGAIAVTGSSPGQLYLNGTNNGALGITLNSNAVTTNIFLFDIKGMLPGQAIVPHSTNTIGTTNFITLTNTPLLNVSSNAVYAANVLLTNGSLVFTGKIFGCNGIATDAGGNNIDLNTSCQASMNSFNGKVTVTSTSGSFGFAGATRWLISSAGAQTIIANPAVTGYRLGGTLSVSNSAIANAGVSATNIFTNSIVAHTMTNNNDEVFYKGFFQFQNASASTNRIRVIYGSEVLLDTGTQTFSNTTFHIEALISRTGNTAQNCEAKFELGGLPVGAPWAMTNSVLATAQTNGINTSLLVELTSLRNGSATNISSRVRYYPAP